jgi:hypothetical protein
MSKTFAGLMLMYASGHDVNIKDVLKDFPVQLNSVHDYANRVIISQTA